MPSIPSKLIFRNFTLFPSHTHTFSFYKTNCIEFKVLSVLITINVQTHSDINPGGQGMIITKQGVAIQPCFQQEKHMQFCNTGQWIVFIKTRTKACIKGWYWTCRLQSLPGSPDRGAVLRARGRKTGPYSLARRTARRRALLRSQRDLRGIQTSTQSRKRNKSFIVELESEILKISSSE